VAAAILAAVEAGILAAREKPANGWNL